MGDYAKTILLLGGLSVVVVLIGGWIGGREGMYLAFLISLLMNLGAYWFSDKLAISGSGAKPVAKQQAPELYKIVEELGGEMKIPVPKLYVIPVSQANAFATGRNPENASVAVTEGIMRTLDRAELKAVLAHEFGHVRNRDILIASVAAVLASTITLLSRIGLYGNYSRDEDQPLGGQAVFGPILALFAPIGAAIVQMAVSREREFEADETGAETLKSGQTLANALEKIHASTKQLPMVGMDPALTSLFIANPLGGFSRMANLFSTHPPMEERVKRLREMKF